MIDNGVIYRDEDDRFYDEVILWAHQCWQLYALGNDIDLAEFKRRMNSEEIDYKQFIIDFEDRVTPEDMVHLQRVIDVLYIE